MNAIRSSLDRVVRQYRQDVNHLAAPATPEALAALESHIGTGLPVGLRAFLSEHDGADLLRGSVRLRSTVEISVADAAHPEVVLFADHAGTQWAFAPDSTGSVFGTWIDGRLTPMHGSFAGWLKATMAVAESRVRDADDLADFRFEADPEDVHQLIHAGMRALCAGEPERAESLLRLVTQRDPARVRGWQFLGDALAITDRTAARQAWLEALRRTSFPLPWPGAPCLSADVIGNLQRAFSDPETWERELSRFLDDRVDDVCCAEAAEVVVAAGRAIAASRIRRGAREGARDALSQLVSRCHGFEHEPDAWTAVLELAKLEADLGSHDEAEALLARLLRHAPEYRGRGLLLLARIATARQEPWAEDILREAQAAGLDEVQQISASLLGAERALRADHLPVAERLVAQARERARRVAIPRTTAALALVEGDLFRAQDRWPEAEARWSEGLGSLARVTDAELSNRLRLRLGDAAAAAGDLPRAADQYAIAAQGFRTHQLRVREAWALLRLAHVRLVLGGVADDLLHAALTRFQQADLAAGIAAVDAVAGRPGAHLDWHLVRARDHARSRYDAQRARPPYDRSDADRPERRLGAHRLAIAACSDAVVEPLERKMAASARAIQAARTNPKDESVLNYIGAVDLLSGHRSWAAAEVLLRHLMEQKVDGHPWRALQGAIARSPNAALVHGLLEQIEVPTGKPAPALAAAAELLGIRRELHAVGPLMRLAGRPHSPTVRKAAILALGRIGDRKALATCAEGLENPHLAEASALSLLLMGDRRGLDFHGRALVGRRTDLSGLPGEIVGRYGGPDHLLLLIGATDHEGPVALGALQGLGLMGDSRAVPTLLAALSSRDRKVKDIALGGLELITGHREEDEPGFRTRWHTWWDQHAPDFPEGVRYREGRLFGPGILIGRLEHSDPWTRRTAYDELCILTGERLAFDAEGPWRLQVAHVRGWKRWWVDNRSQYKAGTWTLDGKKI